MGTMRHVRRTLWRQTDGSDDQASTRNSGAVGVAKSAVTGFEGGMGKCWQVTGVEGLIVSRLLHGVRFLRVGFVLLCWGGYKFWFCFLLASRTNPIDSFSCN